jgi:hypothetical protein
VGPIGAQEATEELAGKAPIGREAALAGQEAFVLAPALERL